MTPRRLWWYTACWVIVALVAAIVLFILSEGA